ncbi:hypothetical protein BH20ACT17_BH20ACT17_02280 [soil metagenome]
MPDLNIATQRPIATITDAGRRQAGAYLSASSSAKNTTATASAESETCSV